MYPRINDRKRSSVRHHFPNPPSQAPIPPNVVRHLCYLVAEKEAMYVIPFSWKTMFDFMQEKERFLLKGIRCIRGEKFGQVRITKNPLTFPSRYC
jgi:hypothetical protein